MLEMALDHALDVHFWIQRIGDLFQVEQGLAEHHQLGVHAQPGPHAVGRVIARPFAGTPGAFLRTEGRRGTVVADVSAPREGRYRQALEHQAGFTLDLSTGIPDATLLPGLARALRAVTTAGTPHSYLDDPVLPELADVLLASWPYPPPALTVTVATPAPFVTAGVSPPPTVAPAAGDAVAAA